MKFPVRDALTKEIPQGDHPGAFGVVRKHHRHEGIDIYAPQTALVHAITTGRIVSIYQFTGSAVGMPWWNDTYAIAIADEDGIWVYGEVGCPTVHKVGDVIEEGRYVGQLTQVLKVDKGRPTTMLHLERWKPFTSPHTFLWQLDQLQPDFLVDPTPLLLEIK